MKKYFYLIMVFFLSNTVLKGQPVVNTDRPDQSDGTHIVEKGFLQIETGAQFSTENKEHDFDNTTLIRYGVTKKFEVRLLNQYTAVRDSMISGIMPFAISFKNLLCQQHGLLPKMTFVSYLRLPVTISTAFPGNHFGYRLILAARHDLFPDAKFYSNFGIEQNQETARINYISTAEVNYNVTPKFSTFAEYFGNYATHTIASNGVDIGFIYAFKNNLAADLSFGSPTLDLGLSKFISFGMSVRLPE